MSRAAPRDDIHAPSLALTPAFVSDVDLTASFPESPHAACEMLATNINAAAQAVVVRLQGAPTTDVSIRIPSGGGVVLRGAFTTLRSTTHADISATFFWQGGAS